MKQRICGSEKWTTRWLKTLECTLGSELMQAKAWWACDSDRVSWHICRHQTWEVCIDFGVRQLMHELLDFSSSQNYSKCPIVFSMWELRKVTWRKMWCILVLVGGWCWFRDQISPRLRFSSKQKFCDYLNHTCFHQRRLTISSD